MKSIRNAQSESLFKLMIIVTLLFCVLFSVYPHWVLFVPYAMLVLYFIKINLKKRDQEIRNLTLYLKRLNQDDYSYDIASYQEGELSILHSEINKTTVTLKQNNEEIRKSKVFLNQLLEDISHQLKTPVTSLSLLNELMDDSEMVAHSRIQIDRLEWLVVSLLKLAQLDVKAIQYKKEHMDITDLINASLSYVETLIKNSDIEINYESKHATIWCDPKWTQEALVNILKNKIKYAQKTITIEIEENRLFTILKVSDDGPEIENKARVFERFYKGNDQDSSSVGIGLSLTQTILNQQDIRISVEEENTFHILFSKS